MYTCTHISDQMNRFSTNFSGRFFIHHLESVGYYYVLCAKEEERGDGCLHPRSVLATINIRARAR